MRTPKKQDCQALRPAEPAGVCLAVLLIFFYESFLSSSFLKMGI